MSEYDYRSYEKNLEKVLESVQKDYWAQYIDINHHQVIVGRTYLWVSAALIGAYAAGYQKLEQLSVHPIISFILITAFFLSAIAFGICLYAIPARKGYKSVHQNGWGEFSHQAYDILCNKKENPYALFLVRLLYLNLV